jgi:putative intracellular protease/amidase
MSNYVGAKVTIMMDGSTCAIVGATQVCPSSGNALVNPGETALLSFPSLTPSAAAGDRFEVLLTAKYVDERTGGSHITSGRIWGAYEQ